VPLEVKFPIKTAFWRASALQIMAQCTWSVEEVRVPTEVQNRKGEISHVVEPQLDLDSRAIT
jgi:hypothetical protein